MRHHNFQLQVLQLLKEVRDDQKTYLSLQRERWGLAHDIPLFPELLKTFGRAVPTPGWDTTTTDTGLFYIRGRYFSRISSQIVRISKEPKPGLRIGIENREHIRGT